MNCPSLTYAGPLARTSRSARSTVARDDDGGATGSPEAEATALSRASGAPGAAVRATRPAVPASAPRVSGDGCGVLLLHGCLPGLAGTSVDECAPTVPRRTLSRPAPGPSRRRWR